MSLIGILVFLYERFYWYYSYVSFAWHKSALLSVIVLFIAISTCAILSSLILVSWATMPMSLYFGLF